MFENAGIYPVALVITDSHDCKDTIIKSVVVVEDYNFYIPNSFTPNNDGINDVFQPKGRGVLEYELTIYNRWQEKIFNSSDFEQGWDGKYKGITCLEGVYVWKISLTMNSGKKKHLNGHLTLYK